MEVSVATTEVEIPVWYGGVEKWITGIHKRTTCEDVVRAMLSSSSSGRNGTRKTSEGQKDFNDYVLVEKWHKVERALDAKSKILKLWSKWGEERRNVKLSLKRTQQPQLKDSTNTRHHTRRHHHSKPSSVDGSKSWHPKKLSLDGAVDMSETMDKLMKLIVSQTETISYQLNRLLDKDKQIEQYETQIHELRMTQIGANYVQDAYLQDRTTSEESTVPNAKDQKLTADETEDAIKIYQDILDLCLRLEEEEGKIANLQSEVDEAKKISDDATSVEDLNSETLKVQAELDRLLAVFQTRENVLSQNDRFIVESDRTLHQKQNLIGQLERDLEAADLETEVLQQQYEALCRQQQNETSLVSQNITYSNHIVQQYPTIVNNSPLNCKGETESLDSDTGLSSLHSSSDEGGYVLDTLV